MTVLLWVSSIAAAAAHVLFFLEESVWWMKPAIHQKTFGMSLEKAETVRLFAFNQGFYNLFLAFELAVGLWLLSADQLIAGTALVGFGCASMLGAAVVLIASDRKFWLGAVVQGVPPSLALLALALR